MSGYIFATKACIDNRKKLVKQQYLLHMSPHNMVNFGLLAAEIFWRVWGTPANFNGFLSWQRYSFFPRLISAVGDWMSTILPHMVWPWCKFRMQVWNVLCAARWKYSTQKNHQLQMWANAQRDGRAAEHRWRPLFNAANFGWRPLLDAVQ